MQLAHRLRNAVSDKQRNSDWIMQLATSSEGKMDKKPEKKWRVLHVELHVPRYFNITVELTITYTALSFGSPTDKSLSTDWRSFLRKISGHGIYVLNKTFAKLNSVEYISNND
jgi:hypothetical protein